MPLGCRVEKATFGAEGVPVECGPSTQRLAGLTVQVTKSPKPSSVDAGIATAKAAVGMTDRDLNPTFEVRSQKHTPTGWVVVTQLTTPTTAPLNDVVAEHPIGGTTWRCRATTHTPSQLAAVESATAPEASK